MRQRYYCMHAKRLDDVCAVMASGRPDLSRYVMRCAFRDRKACDKREYCNPNQPAFAFGRPIAGRFTLEARQS